MKLLPTIIVTILLLLALFLYFYEEKMEEKHMNSLIEDSCNLGCHFLAEDLSTVFNASHITLLNHLEICKERCEEFVETGE